LRPSTYVPGLISVDVLVKTNLACGWVMETVELFMFPGSGQTITTSWTVRKGHFP
jgi:hypothetical protein